LKVAAVRKSPSAAPDIFGLGLLVRYTDSQIICAISNSNSLEMGDILMSCASQDGQPGALRQRHPDKLQTQQKQMKMKTTFPLSLIDNRVLLEFPRADLDDCKRAIGGVVEDGITRSVLRFNPEF
jgi:hypothetical protein